MMEPAAPPASDQLTNDPSPADGPSPPLSTNRPDDEVPYPPRYWWLKRLSIAGGLLLVGLVLLRLWWGWEANRRLQAEIAKWRANGEPVFVDDFDPREASSGERNAAVLYERAIEKLVTMTSAGVTVHELTKDRADIESNLALIEELLNLNRPVFELLSQAQERPESRWSGKLSSAYAAPFRATNQLGRLMVLRARYLLYKNDPEGALSDARLLLHFADSIGSSQTFIHVIHRWAIERFALELIEQTWLSGKLSQTLTKADGQSCRPQMKALLAVLIEEKQVREQFARALLGERALFLQWLETGALTRFPPGLNQPCDQIVLALIKPLLTLRAVRWTDEYSAAARMVRSDAGDLNVTAFPGSTAWSVPAVEGLARELGWNWATPRFYGFYLRSVAERRITAAAIAARLYLADVGDLPKDLGELVPQYLPRVPRDPLSPDGNTLRYSAASDAAKVYGVGYDGADDGGTGDDLVVKLVAEEMNTNLTEGSSQRSETGRLGPPEVQ